MNQVNLSLPLSATALREGSEFLAKLSQLAEVIRAESGGVAAVEGFVQTLPQARVADLDKLEAELQAVAAATDLEDDVETAEQATVITQETLPPVEYETVVTGHARAPGYEGELAAYTQAALETAGWTVEGLLDAGYLVEVTEQRVKPAAAGASAVTPPAPPAPASGDAPVDADGIVWDARIHSDAAERLSAKGLWKRRKNTSDELWNSVRAELGASPAAAPATSAAPTPAATATPPAPSVAPAPPAPSAPAPTSGFPAFTAWMMTHIKAGTLDQTKLTLACQKFGLPNAAGLSANPEHCAAVKADLIATYSLAN